MWEADCVLVCFGGVEAARLPLAYCYKNGELLRRQVSGVAGLYILSCCCRRKGYKRRQPERRSAKTSMPCLAMRREEKTQSKMARTDVD